MSAEFSEEARRAAVDEAVRRSAAACAESAELIAISHELRARAAELKRRIASRSTIAQGGRDTSIEPSGLRG